MNIRGLLVLLGKTIKTIMILHLSVCHSLLKQTRTFEKGRQDKASAIFIYLLSQPHYGPSHSAHPPKPPQDKRPEYRINKTGAQQKQAAQTKTPIQTRKAEILMKRGVGESKHVLY